METLVLADGTILENSHVILTNIGLFVYISNGFNIKQVFDLLYDASKTATITFHPLGAEEQTFTGYTVLTCVKNEGNGLITAVLEKTQVTE